MYYILYAYNKVSYRKENVIKKIVQKGKYMYSVYWKIHVYE